MKLATDFAITKFNIASYISSSMDSKALMWLSLVLKPAAYPFMWFSNLLV